MTEYLKKYRLIEHNPEKQKEVIEEAKKIVGDGRIRVVMHSLAFGALKNFINN